MSDKDNRQYTIDIDPRILELLGPSLYTNIYYVLAELIANAYDANASNVYIIQDEEKIVVEDDGTGMSYDEGDIGRYLGVAVETRTNEEDSYTEGRLRRKIGRKGVGKLAALSVSEKVRVMTIKKDDKSGFVLSRHVGKDHKLQGINQKDIKFQKIKKNGTSVVMTNPSYQLHKTQSAIKNNFRKIFPIVSDDFKIRVIIDNKEIIVDSFDEEMIQGLVALTILGKQYHYLARYFDPGLDNQQINKELLKMQEAHRIPLTLKNKLGETKNYDLQIEGWIGAYRTTKDRKKDSTEFPDNFISIISRGKLGEYNILPVVGKNALQEAYVVGQLYVDLFEETELPDMALSNRQGYKTDDKRYEALIQYVRSTLLPQTISLRNKWVNENKKKKDEEKRNRQKQKEKELKDKIGEYKNQVAEEAAKEIAKSTKEPLPKDTAKLIATELNKALPLIGLKKEVDAPKKRILISHTREDKSLADIIYKLLSFNDVPDKDILYTSCDNEECRVPDDMGVFDYLRDFFVDSSSTEKLFVIYVTSKNMTASWGAAMEVGAGWITESSHKIFNVKGNSPKLPLDIRSEWHTSIKIGEDISMDSVEFDKFASKIVNICTTLGYKPKSKDKNKKELSRYITIIK